jgi:WD40 repeat protein
LWNVASGVGVPLLGHSDRIGSVMFSSDGRTLWTSSDDFNVREWQIAARTSRIIGRRLGSTVAFALAPRDRWIATGDSSGQVTLLDPVTLAEYPLGHHAGGIHNLTFSPDGARLASTGSDRMVRLWDVEHRTLEAVFPLEFHGFSTTWSPDGRSIAVSGQGQVVPLWPVPPRPGVPEDLHDLATWMARLSTASPDPRARAP